MPVVSRSDCTQTNVQERYTFIQNEDLSAGFVGEISSISLHFQSCQGANNNNNDLRAFVQQLVDDGKLSTVEQDIFNSRVIGKNNCSTAKQNLLTSQGFEKGYDIDKSKWTFVVGEGFDDETPITDARLFKEMVEDLEVPIVRRVCPTCSDSHKDTYYRRLTAMPDDFDLLDTLMNNWFDTDNNHNVDFAIYSSYLDAFSDVNRWQFCNFNDPGIGFPRDCGPVKRVNNNWNSYYRGGANAHYHAFLLPANPSFESKLQNLALGRRAIQSSQQHGGGPERAVDGNTVGIWRWNTVTHTRNEENPHWQVDLAHDSTIDTVYIWNRLDCCRDRLSNIRIDVYDYMHGNVVATRNIDGQGKVMNAVDFGGVEGSAIRITRETEPGQAQVMSLAEVQVQGTLGDPVEPDIFAEIQATHYFDSKGICGDDAVGCFDNTDYITYGPVNFGPSGTTKTIKVLFAKANGGGRMEVRLGGSTGTLIGEFKPWNTGGWNNYVEGVFTVDDVEGVHDVTFVAKDSSGVLNLKTFQLADWPEPFPRFNGAQFVSKDNARKTGNNLTHFNGYATYGPIFFGSATGTTKSIRIRYGKGNYGGEMEVRKGGPDGTLIGTFRPVNTGGYGNYETAEFAIDDVVEGHDITFVAKGVSGLLDMKWFETSADEVEGPKPLATIAAADFYAQSGIGVESSNRNIGWYDNNDFMSYGPINFGASGTTKTIRVEFAKDNNGGTMEAWLNGSDGTHTGSDARLLGVFEPWRTGGWQKYTYGYFAIEDVVGVHDLTFVGKDKGGVLNLKSFELMDSSV